jgi:DNA-binding HxlR family transcriptional regulator
MQLPKVTSSKRGSPDAQTHGRWYRDACGAALALELLGERWSLLVVRELMLGALRFSDIRAELPGLSAKVLTERLAGLEQAGVVSRRKLAPPAASQVYELTPWGYEAAPVLRELVLWAMRSRRHDPSLPMTAAAFMQSLQFSLQPGPAEQLEGLRGCFAIGAHVFAFRFESGSLEVERGDAGDAEFTVVAERANALMALVYGRMPFEAWLTANSGRRIEGDRSRLAQFVQAFAWPEKID